MFWPSGWGERPSGVDVRVAVVRARLAEVPPLIPLFAHRFVPAGYLGTVPVFSVMQTDIIYYGMDLAQWAACEFGNGPNFTESPDRVQIPFGASIVEGYGDNWMKGEASD